jgi:signal transduction histidine kinase
MQELEQITEIYDGLRRLAVENPRAARQKIEQLLNDDAGILEAVLARMSVAGEGRLRQLVANAVRSEDHRQRLQEHFAKWLTIETDEFARRAIETAQSRTAVILTKQTAPQPTADPRLVDMYRYVAGRVGHELRNALLAPKTRILRLRQTAQQIDDANLRSSIDSIVAQLEDDFAGVGRVVAFQPDDEHFAIRTVVLCDWIENMNASYAQKYNRIDLTVDDRTPTRKARVLGSDHLLRTIFWNLWVNAHQATGDPCRIRLELEMTEDLLNVTVHDNGEGFPDELVGLAFDDQVSTKATHRGRGLLEINDAIERLHGHAQLARQRSGEHRVRLSFPREPL